MKELPQTLDADEFVELARSLWCDATARVSTVPLELFMKAALRHRVTRDPAGIILTSDRSFETGIAIRALRAGEDNAGFAAASALTTDAIRWAVDTACSFQAQVPATAPAASDGIEGKRWDLDAPASLPSCEILAEAIGGHPSVQWVEGGSTVEVLIGAEGWVAVRGRHRFWALVGNPDPHLLAQRGIANWEQLLDDATAEDDAMHQVADDNSKQLVLTPQAAAPVVAALFEAFHLPKSPPWESGGAGWTLSDEPVHPDGLSGGIFDDAGFPTASLALAKEGSKVSSVGGPGNLWRGSFREPPLVRCSNLVMPDDRCASIPTGARIAGRCRVLPMSADLWVLELRFAAPQRGGPTSEEWLRVNPARLLESCIGRAGPAHVTAEGAIVPALLLDGPFRY